MSEQQEYVGFCICHPNAIVPERKNPGDAGYDLSSVEDLTIAPASRALISTGLKVKLPPGTYGRIAPRSGLSVKGTSVGAGVCDLLYKGEYKVLLFNHSDTPLHIHAGDRIAQLVIEVIKTPPVRIITEEELGTSERGAGGFGSTGK